MAKLAPRASSQPVANAPKDAVAQPPALPAKTAAPDEIAARLKPAERSDAGPASAGRRIAVVPVSPTRVFADSLPPLKAKPAFAVTSSCPKSAFRAELIGRDKFAGAAENAFKVVREAPVSTFSIDVDTASYSFVRASLNRNVLPQPAAVRTEELINYFPYAYPAPTSADAPFRTAVAVFPSPWTGGPQDRAHRHQGLRRAAGDAAARQPRVPDRHVGLDGRAEQAAAGQAVARACWSTQLEAERPRGDRHLCGQRRHRARADRRRPTRRRSSARSSGSRPAAATAGAEGIRQAYALAEQNFDKNGVNRVILATDGDFNVGITDRDELKGFVERERGKRRLPVRARLRHGQLQRRADADAGAERQRHRRLHRHAQRGAQGAGRGGDLDALPDRQGREDPGRVQSGDASPNIA